MQCTRVAAYVKCRDTTVRSEERGNDGMGNGKQIDYTSLYSSMDALCFLM